jgi:hypothetical protein
MRRFLTIDITINIIIGSYIIDITINIIIGSYVIDITINIMYYRFLYYWHYD